MKKDSRTAARALTRKAARISSPPPAAPVPRWLRFWPLYIALAVLAVYSTALGFNFIGDGIRDLGPRAVADYADTILGSDIEAGPYSIPRPRGELRPHLRWKG